MHLKAFRTFILIFLSAFGFLTAEAADVFTPAERAYINRTPAVRIGVAESEPYTFYKSGMMQGFSIDVLHEIEQISGLRFEIVNGNWTEVYNSFIENRIDALNEVSYTPERSRFMLFTEPFHIRKTIFFTKSDMVLPEKNRLGALKGKKVGIIKDIFYANALKNRGFTLVEHSNYNDMMKSLAFGWTDAAVTGELTGLFIARTNSLSNIKPAGGIGIKEYEKEDFRIGVHSEDKMLHGILSKALKQIPPSRFQELQTRWTVYMGRELSPSELVFTESETQFIRTHPAISVGMLNDYAPFSYVYKGRLTGYAVSLLDSIAKKSGLQFSYTVDSWSHLLNKFKNGETDMISNISFTQERTPFTLFTEEYYKIPNVVFINDAFGKYDGLKSLGGKTVGITKDVFFKDKLLPLTGENLVEYATQDDMIRDLSFGKIDAVITALNTGNSLIRKYALVNIKIAEQFRYAGVEMEDLRFGVNPKYPELFSIIQKTMNSIPPEERLRLESIWMDTDSYADNSSNLLFNTAEQKYLTDKKVIKMCIDPSWMPFEMLGKDGEHIGIAADFFALIKEKAGLNIVIVPTETWTQSMEFAKARKCDIFSMAMQTDERSEYMNFTSPYLLVPNVIATSATAPYIEKVDDFLDQKFGIVHGYALEEILRKQYPKIKLVSVKNEEEGIAMLQRGEIFGYIGTMASIGYQIQQQKITDLKISGRLPQEWRLSIAARNDEPLLRNIFEKLINSVDEAQKQEIMNRWVSVRYDRGFDYSLFWKIIAAAAVVFGFVIYWSNKLRILNSRLKEANEKLKVMSERDSLTGLFNRRYFSSHGEATFALCQRSGIRFSIAIIDIDHFKQINDSFGHLFGDRCLQELSELLGKHFMRHSDTIARFGGEEFSVFTADGGDDALYNRVESIRAELAERYIEYENVGTKMTVSAGIYSAVPKQQDTLDTFIQRADDALYQAKADGRNRVVLKHPDSSSV